MMCFSRPLNLIILLSFFMLILFILLFVRYLGRFAVFCGHHAPVLLLLDVKNQKALCHGTQVPMTKGFLYDR